MPGVSAELKKFRVNDLILQESFFFVPSHFLQLQGNCQSTQIIVLHLLSFQGAMAKVFGTLL